MPIYKGFGDFARRGVPAIKAEVRDVGQFFHQEVDRFLRQHLIRKAEGGIGTPVLTGELLAGWRTEPAQVEKIAGGSRSRMWNATEYAEIADRGTKGSGRVHGKMRPGSEQAPYGIILPAIELLDTQADAVAARASRRAEGAHPG